MNSCYAYLKSLIRQRMGAPDYNQIHVNRAASLVPVKHSRVLVIGCNTGRDCGLFRKAGAPFVCGLDVVDEIGRDCRMDGITYVQASAEKMPFGDSEFDLVYSFATMEHVPDIHRAFSEMARVLALGGYIYSVASPLWNSPYGHHKPDIFNGYPWIHLTHKRDDILELCRLEGIQSPNSIPLSDHVDYMLNPEFFNMLPAATYISACASLQDLKIIRNNCEQLPNEALSKEIESKLSQSGINREECLSVTHTVIARKPRRSSIKRLWRRISDPFLH